MGGGKSRTMCEDAFDKALNYPGIVVVICRQQHTSIIETTKRTMMTEVIPHQAIKKQKESGGEDYVELWNGSTIHFIGLDDPVRWFSSELGELYFDEAHEISEDTVVKLITRLRQRGMTHGISLGFNPENPGHWLYKWFIEGANPTKYGYFKDKLLPTDAISSIGSAEFVIAKAAENIYLPDGYVEQTLGSLPELLRRRYLEGEWLFVSGRSFFDTGALDYYRRYVRPPRWVGRTQGDASAERKRPCRIQRDPTGNLWIWEPPNRGGEDRLAGRRLPPHRYIISVDVSSGTANDYSAIQVIDVDSFAQVAELQAKLDPDLVAVEAARLGYVYNTALIAPEVTGGWGFSVVRELEKLRYRKIYTRRIEDRLKKTWTDRLGWDTTTKSRAVALDTLNQVVREKEFKLNSPRAHTEMVSFVWQRDKAPEAQPGCNDDLVMSLAIGVVLASTLPREQVKLKDIQHTPSLVTGY